jgi:hypothetical protein
LIDALKETRLFHSALVIDVDGTTQGSFGSIKVRLSAVCSALDAFVDMLRQPKSGELQGMVDAMELKKINSFSLNRTRYDLVAFDFPYWMRARDQSGHECIVFFIRVQEPYLTHIQLVTVHHVLLWNDQMFKAARNAATAILHHYQNYYSYA